MLAIAITLGLSFGASMSGAGGAEDVALRLAELSSPVAAERARAERWLAANLSTGDVELVARTVIGSDAEVRRRLLRSVGSDGRHLGLAAGLAAYSDPSAVHVREVGRDAVRELALSWSPAAAAPALSGGELAYALQRSLAQDRARLLRVDLGAPLGETLDLLRRSGELPVNLVLDPRVGDVARRRAATGAFEFVAGWPEVLTVLAGVHGVALSGVGIGSDGEMPGGAFLVFHAHDAAGASGAGLASLLEWIDSVAASGDSPRAPAQAVSRRRRMEALLASGWPAAWEWIGRLQTAGDVTAGEALTAVAATGVWPLSWRDRSAVDALLSRLELLTGPGAAGFESAAVAVAHALGAAPARLADGAVVPALLGESWEAAGPDRRLLLLVALEGVGAIGSREQIGAWEARLGAVFADGTSSAPLARQALRAWRMVLTPHGVDPPRPGAGILGADRDWSGPERRELAGLLLVTQAVPPALAETAFDGSGDLRGALGARVTATGWLAGAGETQRAAEILRNGLVPVGTPPPATGAPPGELDDPVLAFGALVDEMARRGDRALAIGLLDQAVDGVAPDVAARLQRVRLVGGLLAPADAAELCRTISAEPIETDAQLFVLAAAAGVPEDAGDPARERLSAILGESLADVPEPTAVFGVISAVERALARLLRAGADVDAGELRRMASVRVFSAPAGDLRDRLATSGWPQIPPPMDVVELQLQIRP